MAKDRFGYGTRVRNPREDFLSIITDLFVPDIILPILEIFILVTLDIRLMILALFLLAVNSIW